MKALTNHTYETTGILLCGGNSSRMGHNKALLPWKEKTLLEILKKELEAVCEVVYISGDPEIYSRYADNVVADIQPGMGPAGGMQSVLRLPSARFLVLACDLPYMNRAFLSWFLQQWNENDKAICLEFNGQLHPLCAIYHKDCLPVFESAVKNGELRMQEIFRSLGGRSIHPDSFSDWNEKIIMNVNTMEDFKSISENSGGIKVLFFGSLAEKTGVKEMNVNEGADLDSLKYLLQLRFPLLKKLPVLIAVNQEVVYENLTLHPGDEVALMPPFAGG